MQLRDISRALSERVDRLWFGPPVTHVYNPLAYARAPHEAYLERWGAGPKPVLLLGMNPGPFGMAQTGVPFGEVDAVRGWLRIEATVHRPPSEHPKRRVLGFDCPRSEVSGARLWGWARDRFGTPERFFEQFLVVNYCPLAFMETSGKNRTPDQLPVPERAPLFAACDDALRATVDVLAPRTVIGIGAFAAKRAAEALQGRALVVASVLHPSPASPKANRGWAEAVTRELDALGIAVPAARPDTTAEVLGTSRSRSGSKTDFPPESWRGQRTR